MNWDSFLLQSKDTPERQRADATVGRDSEANTLHSDMNPIDSAGKTIRRDERRNVGLWGSKKSVIADAIDVEGANLEIWHRTAQVDTIFLLDLAYTYCM